jgi:hypothetical protein
MRLPGRPDLESEVVPAGRIQRSCPSNSLMCPIGQPLNATIGAIGTVTNLAARLCGEAGPGQILISRRLLGLVEDLVDAEPVGD